MERFQVSEERMGADGGLHKFQRYSLHNRDYIVGYYSTLRLHEYDGGLSPKNQKNDTGKL